jgi:DNA-binding YbaB/EbfC family protein
MANMFEMLKNAGAMKAKMEQLQADMASKSFEADAGAGRVVAKVSGKMQLERIVIDKSRIDLTNTEMLEDLVVAAVNAAQQKAALALKEEMDKMKKALGLPEGLI